MNKVYVAWVIPEYIGIDIIGIFSNKEDAYKAVKKFLEEDHDYYNYDDCGVDEYEVQ